MPSTTRAGGLLVAAGLAVSTCFAMTALGAPGTEVGFPQHPSVSPDGRTIVFAWAGDLWAVSSDGGNAVRLTSHPATEGRSAFSPDGSRLVFESSRSGASNLFEVEVTGSGSDLVVGEPRRVTMSPSSQMLGGYSADGSEIYYSSFEERGIFRHPKMFAAPIDGGPVRMLAEGAHGREPRPAGDGRGILFSRGYWNWERPEYRGTGDSDVWYYNTRDGSFRQLTEFEGMDGMAYALPNGQVAYVSSRTDDNNVFRMSLRTGDDQQPRRMSAFAPEGDRATIGHGVRDFAVSASGELGVMTMWDGLYTIDLRSGNTSPQRVDVRAAADTDELDTRFLDLGREVDEMAISPDGKTVAVIARGEVFVRPAGEERPARRVTHTAARETGVTWSPDGQHLYFASNADGRSDIHRAMVTLTRESLANNDPFGDLNIQAEPQAAEDKPQTAGEASPAAGDWACITVVPEMGGEIEFTLSLSVDDANNVTGSAVVPAMGSSMTTLTTTRGRSAGTNPRKDAT